MKWRLPGSATQALRYYWKAIARHCERGVRRFIRALPRDAKVYGLELDANRAVVEASLATIAEQLILVDIRLDT